MAPPVYSTRLLHGRSGTSAQELIVPPASRIVVRFVTIVTFVGQADYVIMRVAGVQVLLLDTPTQEVTKHYDMRCVAYTGETIEMFIGGGDVAWHVSGFLFADT